MPGIVEFPKVVQDALDHYGDLFGNECQRRHFAEYLTGLFVAERKTVLGCWFQRFLGSPAFSMMSAVRDPVAWSPLLSIRRG